MKVLIINCSPVRTGATAEIVRTAEEVLREKHETRTICIDDYRFSFCTGCRQCHKTGVCFLHDGVDQIMEEFDEADVIVAVSPSYWADVPGQFKAFIDRCTPFSNTHTPRSQLKPGKKGYAIVLRTGTNMKECERLIETLEHFYGHLDIEAAGHLGLNRIEFKEDVAPRADEIRDFCRNI